MLWMETYLLYCSVRLGVVVIAVLTFLQLFIPAILLLAQGTKILEPIVQLFENDDYYRRTYVVVKVTEWIQNSTQTFLILLNSYLFLHMSTCILMLIGAIKLQKWLLVPFAVLEFVRVVYCLTWHIVLMIVLKKILNLGVLIAFTLLGGFMILYLFYNWCACVALFQIIKLINSDRYKAIYGEDPFKPQVLDKNRATYEDQFAYGTIENVRVLITPNANEIDEQKQTNKLKAKQTIIAVLPASNNFEHNKKEARKQPRSFWQQSRRQQQVPNQEIHHNDFSTDYGNWHWAELQGVAKKPNALIGQNWR